MVPRERKKSSKCHLRQKGLFHGELLTSSPTQFEHISDAAKLGEDNGIWTTTVCFNCYRHSNTVNSS